MSRGGSGGRTRVKTARGRTTSSNRWLERQLNDPYVKRAHAKFLRGVRAVIDLGIAPGGWTQVVRKQCPKARVVGIDLLHVDPIPGVEIVQMDFTDDGAPAWLTSALGGPADLVLSDMAANTVGHAQTDHLRTMGLVELAVDFACHVLMPGGTFVAKSLAGGADSDLVAELKRNFASVKHAKPPASRKGSSEWYVVAQGFKGAI
jgi:23S rRNA (uridine2552-2'-O)-methyltransferase